MALGCDLRPCRGKYTPWDTTQDLTNKHDLDGRSKEDDEDEPSEAEEGQHKDFAMSPFRSRPPVKHCTHNVRDGANGIELLLPGSGNLKSRFFVEVLAVLLAESGISKERSYECNIITC